MITATKKNAIKALDRPFLLKSTIENPIWKIRIPSWIEEHCLNSLANEWPIKNINSNSSEETYMAQYCITVNGKRRNIFNF
jgi:hypothetical protein